MLPHEKVSTVLKSLGEIGQSSQKASAILAIILALDKTISETGKVSQISSKLAGC